MERTSIAILIISWNSSALLARCLECIDRQKSIKAKVFVLDNNSRDSIPEQLYTRFPSVKFIKNKKNLGFAAGNNLLLPYTADCKWIATVNPDTFLEPDWLYEMLSAAEKNPRYDFFASHLVQAANHQIVDSDGDMMHASGKAWQIGHGQFISKSNLCLREVFSPCAAAAFYRQTAVVEVGGFDEDFFVILRMLI